MATIYFLSRPDKFSNSSDSFSLIHSGFVGQLALGKICKTSTPTLVKDFMHKGLSVKKIFSGSHHNAAITNDGNLYTWVRTIFVLNERGLGKYWNMLTFLFVSINLLGIKSKWSFRKEY